MTKRAVFINPDTGILAVVIPAYNDATRPSGVSDDDILARSIKRAVPDGVAYTIVDDTDAATMAFLSDRTFRDAWDTDGDGTPIVNMTKARAIHMDRIRAVRNAELSKKDVTYTKAAEAGDTGAQSTIATEKQTLRDIPATFDITTGVTTPEQLDARWPAELPARE